MPPKTNSPKIKGIISESRTLFLWWILKFIANNFCGLDLKCAIFVQQWRAISNSRDIWGFNRFSLWIKNTLMQICSRILQMFATALLRHSHQLIIMFFFHICTLSGLHPRQRKRNAVPISFFSSLNIPQKPRHFFCEPTSLSNRVGRTSFLSVNFYIYHLFLFHLFHLHIY